MTAIRNAATDGNPDTDADTDVDAAAGHAAPPVLHLRRTARSAPRRRRCWRTSSATTRSRSRTRRRSAAGGATVTRSFDGFREAAEEAGASRIYGGIHW